MTNWVMRVINIWSNDFRALYDTCRNQERMQYNRMLPSIGCITLAIANISIQQYLRIQMTTRKATYI